MSGVKPIGLIVGLGNPGEQYSKTRHNAGFWFVDALAERYAASFKSDTRFKAQICRIVIDERPTWLLKPETYMNMSGRSVAACAAYYKLGAAETLVAHDELSLASGVIRFKKGGGHGGHNGLRDVTSHLGADFSRLRIGIGRPPAGQDVARYVLNVAPAKDRQAIDLAINATLERISTITSGKTDDLEL